MTISGRYDNDIGPILGSAQEGFDRSYQRTRRKADAELEESLAGRPPADVPADDAELKNPDGEYAVPAHGLKRPRRTPGPRAPQDSEGRQGGYAPAADRPNRN